MVMTGGYSDPVGLLTVDLPTARAEGREAALPDPDVDAVHITVQARGLMQDPQSDDSGYVTLYETERAFSSDPEAALTVDLSWTDVHDARTLAAATGPVVLPTARDVRLRLAARGREDTVLAYFGADDIRHGPAVTLDLRAESRDETALFAQDTPGHRFSAVLLQPDPPVDSPVAAAQRAGGDGGQRPADIATRLAAHLGLAYDGRAFRGLPGRRTVFGCSGALRHLIGPDGASIAFASPSDLARRWLCVVRLRLDRDWTWDGVAYDGITVLRDGTPVGAFAPGRSVSAEALHLPDGVGEPDRGATDLVFFDAVEPHPAPGAFPDVQHPVYRVETVFQGSPTADPAVNLGIALPVAVAPSQVPRVVSAGIALSPYERSADYASTAPRRRMLWLELDRPPDDPHDAYFARVLAVAPDPLLSRPRFVSEEEPVSVAEPPMPVDPEWIRVVVEGQSDDRAGLDAMQPLIPSSDSPHHFLLPLPPGTGPDDPALFGFYTYELRVGHATVWSTAQGRFGPPLRVTGVQHPPPQLSCAALRDTSGITVSAPFAVPVATGAVVQAAPPRSALWVLLYAQAVQVDGQDRRNILLGRKPASWSEQGFSESPWSTPFGTATFSDAEVRATLREFGFAEGAPLSALAVEVLHGEDWSPDPLGSGLGTERVLRSSTLTPVPMIC
ncbi:hypothetical protein ACIBW9_36940 [Streptomyces sp. NPDC049541]|uniref:hypothetical protein n=1 Tax=Streptomyces sp. NPDC049541 TaxID=3365594 RepID=UPI00378B8A84